MRRREQLFAVLPTLLTLGNVACGFGALTLAASGYEPSTGLFAAAGLIFLAMAFDAVDGSAARWANQTTEFGARLDSLCDAISFGAAPAVLMFQFALPHGHHPRLLWVIAALYVVCAVLRLARFTAEAPGDGPPAPFRGLPSPAAAGVVASFPVMVYGPRHLEYAGRDPFGPELSAWLDGVAVGGLPVVTLVVAYLMVSSVRYAHLVHYLARGRRSRRHVTRLVFAVAAVAVAPQVAAPMLFCWYSFVPPVRSAWARWIGRGAVPAVPRVDARA